MQDFLQFLLLPGVWIVFISSEKVQVTVFIHSHMEKSQNAFPHRRLQFPRPICIFHLEKTVAVEGLEMWHDASFVIA